MKLAASQNVPDFNSPTWKWVTEQLRAMESSCLGSLRGMKDIRETDALRGDLRTVDEIAKFPQAYSNQNHHG